MLFNFCNSPENNSKTDKNQEGLNIKQNTREADTNYKGVMMIEEQPVLCVLDSASPKETSQKMQENYNKILKDVDYTGAKVAEQSGCIFYYSSSEKIVFETFMFLKSKPTKQLKFSKPVVLEKTLALLYEHYGTFNTIHLSYAKIEKIMNQEGYKQSGPSREVYVLNEDTAKWRTQIIVPVIKNK